MRGERARTCSADSGCETGGETVEGQSGAGELQQGGAGLHESWLDTTVRTWEMRMADIISKEVGNATRLNDTTKRSLNNLEDGKLEYFAE